MLYLKRSHRVVTRSRFDVITINLLLSKAVLAPCTSQYMRGYSLCQTTLPYTLLMITKVQNVFSPGLGFRENSPGFQGELPWVSGRTPLGFREN